LLIANFLFSAAFRAVEDYLVIETY